MNIKKWPTFEDCEEIFGKDKETKEFAEAWLDATKKIQKSQTPQLCDDMSLRFLIDVDDEEKDNAYHSSKVGTGEAENADGHSAFTTAEDATETSLFSRAENATGLSVFIGGENATGASTETSKNENFESRQTHKQGEYAKRLDKNNFTIIVVCIESIVNLKTTIDATMEIQGMAKPKPHPNVSCMYDMTDTPSRMPQYMPKYHQWKNALFFLALWAFFVQGNSPWSSN
ncbi:hypothetical protein FXO38_07170 [Capsicum annuum]|uniref:Uncharacterized protein n=1 Tax=Capsicum annuum TaxID=4072 RepID=A0A2G2ZNA7_CAPAN|nr:hypothetical protein FXO38_07170 [Capsicum annuum]KAF3672364.1 hypothetical protein FXO37_07547 [Capsicum annuum]PHT83476.1 hypothetical protein T459_11919 [Capsicum annuum]